MTLFAMSMAAGALQLLTACAILGKELLLRPEAANYPTGSRRQRLGLFALGLVLLYFGAETLQLAWTGHRFSRPSALILSVVWLHSAEAELERILRQWLPARLQARIQKLLALASCRNAKVVREARRQALAAVAAAVEPPAPAHAVAASLAALTIAGADLAAPAESASEADVGLGAGLRRAFPPMIDGADNLLPPDLRD